MTSHGTKYWSFSRVSTYNDCPYAFELIYNRHIESASNALAEFGSFIHEILEKYYNNELNEFELTDYYESNYKLKVVSKFPKYLSQESYYNKGYEYLANFSSVKNKYEVIGVEIPVRANINGYNFYGIIDLLLKDKESGEYVVYDHKSKSEFKSKKEKAHYLRQLYLYSYYVFKNYKKYPAKLIFNMFRKGEEIETAFDEDAFNEAIDWFTNTIKEIESTVEFKEKEKPDFYCRELCGVREFCDNGLE